MDEITLFFIITLFSVVLISLFIRRRKKRSKSGIFAKGVLVIYILIIGFICLRGPEAPSPARVAFGIGYAIFLLAVSIMIQHIED